jgi:hypothetical protein
MARTDTNEYVACCREKGCGYGYVSALVYGDGEYATGSDERVQGGVEIAFAGGEGRMRLSLLHRRKVRGWLAALVTVTDQETRTNLGPLGAAIDEDESLGAHVKGRYYFHKIRVQPLRSPDGSTGFVLTDSAGPVTENEFVRRYRTLLGSHELDHVEKRRNWVGVAVIGSLFAAASAVTVWGAMNIRVPCDADDGVYASGCDHTVEHSLPERDTHQHVQRYNRALLRRTIREVQDLRGAAHRAQPPIQLGVGPGSIQLMGRF